MKNVTNMGLSSNEAREQRIMKLRSDFNHQQIVTVAAAVKATGYSKSTIMKWCKDGNIPLMLNQNETVVPMTDQNRPKWL